MTLREYLTPIYLSDVPLGLSYLIYQPWITDDIPDFIQDQNFIYHLGQYLYETKGDYELRELYTKLDDSTLQKNVERDCTIVYINNAYKLTTLYGTTQLEYNPIENYSMVEDGKDDNKGVDKDTTQYGSTIRTDKIGGSTRTDNIGTRTTTGSDTIGNQQTTDTDKVSPDEYTNYVSRSQQITESISHTDSMQRTQQGTIDTSIMSERSDTSTMSEHSDINTYEHGHSITHHLTRSGNVGVTTSQQMILSERDVSDFSIYQVVGDMIVHQICKLVFS